MGSLSFFMFAVQYAILIGNKEFYLEIGERFPLEQNFLKATAKKI